MKDKNTRYSICKKCLLKNIDIMNIKDIKKILKIFNVPFIYTQWINIYERIIKLSIHNNKNYDKTKVFGLYLREMYLPGFRNYGFNDTDKLNQCEYERELRDQKILIKAMI